MTREDVYTEVLRELGLWRPAFAGAVRALAELERDVQRLRKAWVAAGSDPEDPTYERLAQGRRDILAHRSELGLTPRGLHAWRPELFPEGFPAEPRSVLEALREKYREGGGAP